MHEDLAAEIEELHRQGAALDKARAREVFGRLRALLSGGDVRAAEPDPSTHGSQPVGQARAPDSPGEELRPVLAERADLPRAGV